MPLEETTISLKQRDTYRWETTLPDPETGEPYDLTDANEVRLYVEHGRSEDLVVNSPVEILDAENGEVAYDLSRAETARSGTHRAEFEIDESSDGEDDYTTVPDDGYVRIDVTRMLNRNVDAEPAEIRGDWEVTRVTATESVRSPAGRFAEQLGFPVYSTDGDAPRETGYFNETDGQLKYKDRGGGVHAGGGGLSAGEDFDGEGTSSFTNLESVGVESLQHTPRDPSSGFAYDRPVVSTEPLNITLDAANGDDSNDGTTANPIASIAELWSRIPMIVQHQVTVSFNSGAYPVSPSPMIWVHAQKGGELTFEGDTTTPDNVEVNGDFWTLQIQSNAPHRTVFKGIRFKTQAHGYDLKAKFENCHFDGPPADGNNSTPLGVGSYGGFVWVENCTFGGTCDWAFTVKQGCELRFTGCDGAINQELVRVLRGGTIQDGGGNSISYTDELGGPNPETAVFYDADGYLDTQNGVRGALSSAGYQSGDFVPMFTGPVASDDTTTSTTFQQLSGPSNFLSVSTDDFPADAQVAVKFYGYALSGSDTESATFRLARRADDAIPGTETSITSAGGEMIESPLVEITLNDGYWGTDTFVGEAKHETGNSTARIRAMRVSIGIVLP